MHWESLILVHIFTPRNTPFPRQMAVSKGMIIGKLTWFLFLFLQEFDLKKPLKIKYVGGGEEGLDMGGLQKEFFHMIVEAVFDPGNIHCFLSFCLP